MQRGRQCVPVPATSRQPANARARNAAALAPRMRVTWLNSIDFHGTRSVYYGKSAMEVIRFRRL